MQTRSDGETDSRRFLSLGGSPRFIFRLLVAGLIASTGIGVTYALVSREELVASFPGAAQPVVYGGFLTVAGAGLVSLVGLWWWRRWALMLYGVATAGSLVLDVIAAAPLAHQVTVIVSATAVFALAYLDRVRFRSG